MKIPDHKLGEIENTVKADTRKDVQWVKGSSSVP